MSETRWADHYHGVLIELRDALIRRGLAGDAEIAEILSRI